MCVYKTLILTTLQEIKDKLVRSRASILVIKKILYNNLILDWKGENKTTQKMFLSHIEFVCININIFVFY